MGNDTKTILLTGVSGTLGFNVASLLADHTNYKIVATVRTPQPFLATLASKIEILHVDLCDLAAMKRAMTDVDPDVVVHCAASGLRPPRASWFEMMSFNVETTLRIFETYCRLSARQFIYISTGLVYREQQRPLREDDPIESLQPYGASKAAADSLLQAGAVEFEKSVTILRPFAFTGLQDGGDRLFPAMLRSSADGIPFQMSIGDQVRDFCAVQDISCAVLRCIEREPCGGIEKFNLGSGIAGTIRQLVERIRHELDLDVNIQFGARPYFPHEPMYLVPDTSAAQQFLGWQAQTNVAFAVWELAQDSFPQLKVRKPAQGILR